MTTKMMTGEKVMERIDDGESKGGQLRRNGDISWKWLEKMG